MTRLVKVTIDTGKKETTKELKGPLTMVGIIKDREDGKIQYETGLRGEGKTEEILVLGASAFVMSLTHGTVDILRNDPTANIAEVIEYILNHSKKHVTRLTESMVDEIRRLAAEEGIPLPPEEAETPAV